LREDREFILLELDIEETELQIVTDMHVEFKRYVTLISIKIARLYDLSEKYSVKHLLVFALAVKGHCWKKMMQE